MRMIGWLVRNLDSDPVSVTYSSSDTEYEFRLDPGGTLVAPSLAENINSKGIIEVSPLYDQP